MKKNIKGAINYSLVKNNNIPFDWDDSIRDDRNPPEVIGNAYNI